MRFWSTSRIITKYITEFVMSQMHNPPHPGLILKDTVLREDGGISVTEFAKKLHMTREGISRVVNGKAGISAELAVRLASLLNVSARSWLTMQAEYDLWQIRNKRRPKIRPLAAEGVQGGG
jgi:addiction module HigA family antidote